MDDEELQDHLKRQALIRTAIASGDPVVVRIHPHFNVMGFVAYVEWRDVPRIYGCTLTYQTLLKTSADPDIVVMEKRERSLEGDPERAVKRWLGQEFGGLDQTHVRIERYVIPEDMKL